MEAAELDNLLEELETRVERLRSLYDQYFLGIEKIPPAVAQKDVDRRIYVLRREQIRNTAKRFKLQTIIQRYNTFQQYWMRILREIENGTYRRHVLRAEQTVGVANLLTSAERKRLGLPERDGGTTTPQATVEADPSRAAQETVPSEQQDKVTEPGIAASASTVPTPIPTAASQMREQTEHDLTSLLDDLDDLDTGAIRALNNELDDPLSASMPPPPRKRQPSAKPLARRSTRPTATAQHARLPHERRFQRDSGPPSSPQSPAVDAEGQTPMRPPRRSARPSRLVPALTSPSMPGPAAKAGLRLPATSAVAGRGLPPLPKHGVPRGAPLRVQGERSASGGGSPPTEAVSPATAAKAIPSPESPPILADAKPVGRPKPPLPESAPQVESPAKANVGQSVPPQLPLPMAPEPQPRPQTEPLKKPSRRPPPTPPAPPSGRAHEPLPNPPSRQPLQTQAAAPEPPPKPQSRQQLQIQAAAPEPPAKKSESTVVVDRSKVEQVADKLRSARTQTHESNEVSVDALAKKLQVAAEELHRKHAGRRIDFDVVIKEGKAIIKPIVR